MLPSVFKKFLDLKKPTCVKPWRFLAVVHNIVHWLDPNCLLVFFISFMSALRSADPTPRFLMSLLTYMQWMYCTSLRFVLKYGITCKGEY